MDVELLTRPQLAKAINVSSRTIDNLQRQKKIPFLRISKRCVRFHLPSVLRALNNFEVKEVVRPVEIGMHWYECSSCGTSKLYRDVDIWGKIVVCHYCGAEVANNLNMPPPQ